VAFVFLFVFLWSNRPLLQALNLCAERFCAEDYSNRSSAAGSDLAARRAGKPQASAATIVNTETTTRLVTESLGETATSNELSAPPTANDRANPITSPIANRRGR